MLHTADVHLGLSGLNERGLEERAFTAAIDLAIDRDVDAILIAGDLFDHARVPDSLLEWTAKQLDRAERPVVLLAGNHDPLNGQSVHHRFSASDRCAQATLLDQANGSTVEVPGADIVVWGRAMAEHVPSFRPLDGVPPKPAGRWSVVAGHGITLATDQRSHHGSPITPAEIAVIDWDYVALGHHHGHKVLREAPRPVLYSGATARSYKGAPGAVIVDFTPGAGAAFEWTPLDVG
jgi:DNA repair exonuclease SbcCD nuclease subunit